MESSERERCETIAVYVIENGATVRRAAKHFGISKSTVHKDLTWRLRWSNHRLWEEVEQVLQQNKSERHLRGGEATRKKYLLQRMKQQP